MSHSKRFSGDCNGHRMVRDLRENFASFIFRFSVRFKSKDKDDGLKHIHFVFLNHFSVNLEVWLIVLLKALGMEVWPRASSINKKQKSRSVCPFVSTDVI